MAFLCALRPSELILGFHRPTTTAQSPGFIVLKLGTRAPPTPSNLRFRNAIVFQVRRRLSTVFASNANPSGEESIEERSDGSKTGDAGQGPPLLTILAGFLIFFLVCWIIGSIVMWLVGLIVNLPPSK